MGDVVDLVAVRASREVHTRGPCLCLFCHHSWTGVVPLSLPEGTLLECPACDRIGGVRGATPGASPPAAAPPRLTCPQGNVFLCVVQHGVYCPCCEAYWSWEDLRLGK